MVVVVVVAVSVYVSENAGISDWINDKHIESESTTQNVIHL
jgi:hypothetical protein